MSLYAGNSNLSPFITLANWDKNEQEQVSKSRMNGKEEGKTRRGRRRGREGEKSNSLCEIDIKEIRIQRRLNQSCTHCDWIHRVFRKVPVSIKRSPNLSSATHAFSREVESENLPINPIWYVQRPVRSQCEQVMSSDVLCFSRSLEHEELR